MDVFLFEDRVKDFKDIDFSVDKFFMQRSLGLNWEFEFDLFIYCLLKEERFFSKWGLLLIINGIFDFIGFVVLVVVFGKILMREILRGLYNWDDFFFVYFLDKWLNWKNFLRFFEDVYILRIYIFFFLLKIFCKEFYIFLDVLEVVIVLVVYLCIVDDLNNIYVGFILGKCKFVLISGYFVLCLEFCVVVMFVQLYDIISEELDMKFNIVRFYIDSMVVLGYINNKGKRFFKYVEN